MLQAFLSIGFLQVLLMLANIGRSKALALALGPAMFGVAATIDQLVMSLAQIGNLSVPFTALKFLSHAHSQGDAAFARVYAVFFRGFLALALGLTVVLVVLMPFGIEALAQDLAPYRRVIGVALLSLPSTMLLMFLANAMAARQIAVRAVGLLAVSAVFVAIAAGAGAAVGGLAGVYFASVPTLTAVVAGAAFALAPRRGSARGGAAESVRDMLRRQPEVAQTALLTFLAVAAYAVLMFSARYVALSALGATAAGLLQAALAIALSTAAVLSPVNTLLLVPRVNRAISNTEKFAVAHAFVPRLLALFGVGGLIAVIAPEPVLRILFSRDFAAASGVVMWFVVWQLLVQTGNVYQQLLIGMDDVVGGSVGLGIGHLVSTVLCFAWAPRLGLHGIGLAFVVGAVVSAAATVVRLRVTHGAALPREVVRVWAGTGGLLVAGHLFWRMSSMSTWNPGVRAGGGVVLIAALWWFLPSAVRSEVRAVCGRWPGLAWVR